MAKVKIQGHASGTGVLTVTAPNTSTDRTITLPDATGTLATTADSVGGANGVDFNDNVKARFGTGNDLEIYHSGNDSIISDTTSVRRLLIQGNDVTIRNADSSKDAAKFNNGGSVDLYHNNAVKLATTATGIAVTGGVAIGGTGTANTLDDYEEGTWTPTVGDGNIGAASGEYTKIGNFCIATFTLKDFSNKTSSNTIAIRSIPFTQDGTATVGTVIAYQNGQSNPLNLIKGASFDEFNMFYMYNASGWGTQKHNTLGGDPHFYCVVTYKTT